MVEVTLVMTGVEVEVALEVGLEVGGGVVVLFEVGATHFPFRAVPNPHHSDAEDEELVVGLDVGGGVVVVLCLVDDDTVLLVEDGLHLPSAAVPKPHQCDNEEDEDEEMLVEETVEAVVVLLIMGMAIAELARAARTKEREARILVYER